MVCCQELPASAYADRYGALAVLNPTPSSPRDSSDLAGRISFFNESDHDCQVATHIQFSPSGAIEAKNQFLFVHIHELGDLSVASTLCEATSGSIPLWPEIGQTTHTGVSAQPAAILRRLNEPLHLHVGNDQFGNKGIIGRRITMCCAPSPSNRAAATVVAEGIVGYNSMPKKRSQSSLSTSSTASSL